MRTYGFIATKFYEGVKKGANPREAKGYFDVLRIGSGENFDMALKGLDDRKHHFFKVGIQEVGLLLVTFYLCKERTGSLSESSPSRRVYSHLPSLPWNAAAAVLFWHRHETDLDLG